jgi:SAM-dependent methyltransferase
MTPRFIARQLSHPTGLLGGLVGRLMNRRNAAMNAFAVQQLELQPADRVLEIGFGGGVNLAALLESSAFVGGVDPSRWVVERARASFADAVKADRADFRLGSADSIPFASPFQKVCTVNTVYFWKSLYAGFAEIRRVMEPGGRVAIGFLPKQWMDRMGLAPDIFTPRTPEEIATAMSRAGLTEVRLARPRPSTAWAVMIATR